MSLSIKDLFTTALAIVTTLIAYANWKGTSLPFLSSPRAMTIALLFVGIAMCAYGSTIDPARGYWATSYVAIMTVIGTLALIIGIIGLITGSQAMLLALAGTILVLYLASTIRHIVA